MSVAAGTVLLTCVGLFSQLVGFFYRVALSRLIGAENMGLYQLVMPVYSTLMSMTAVGLTVALSTLTARCKALGDEGAVKQARGRSVRLFFLMAVPLGLVLVAASDPISVYLLGDARTRLALMLLAPCVLLTGVENLHKHCFYGLGQVVPPAISETLEQLVRTGAVLGLLLWLKPAHSEGKVGAIVAGMVLCEVCSAATLTLLLQRRWRKKDPGLPRSPVSARAILAIALPVSLTSLLGTLLGAANSVLIPARLTAGGMAPSAAMASFGVLCGMTMPLLAMPTGFVNALCLTMVPDLARRTAGGERGAAGEFLGKSLRVTSTLMAPAMALLTVIGPTVGRLMYREEGVGGHMAALAAGTLLSCWQSVLSGALNGLGLQGKGARNAILSDAVQVGFTLFTVARWGLRGFVAGFVLSSLVGAALNLADLLRYTGQRPRLWRWFGSPTLSAAFMGLWCNLFFLYTQRAGWNTASACLTTAALGVILYAAAMMAQGKGAGK